MDVEGAGDDDAGTHVIFSLVVNSEHPIAAFADVPGRRRTLKPDDDFLYDFGRVSFSDNDWDSRSDRLDTEVN